MSHKTVFNISNQLSTLNTVETPHESVNFWPLVKEERSRSTFLHSSEWLKLRSSCPLPVCHRPHHSLLHLLLSLGQMWVSIYHLAYTVLVLFSFVIELRKGRTISYTHVLIRSRKKGKRIKRAPHILPPVCFTHIQCISGLYRHLSLPPSGLSVSPGPRPCWPLEFSQAATHCWKS